MKPKKSLGQHFLQDKKALETIVSAADLQPGDNILEIGSGTGNLTRKLMKVHTIVRTNKERTSGKVIAIEKDNELVLELKKQSKGLKIINGDILEINLPQLIEENDFFDYKIVANIPYYITGKIIRLLFETKYSPKLIVLLVQKEVAQRICSKGGKMSILSASVQFFGKPEIVDFVSRESFDLIPKVDSAILKITPSNNQEQLKDNAKLFFKIVKAGFSSKRKTLANNLSVGLKIEKNDVVDVLESLRMSKSIRAQELDVDDWKKLEKIFLSKKK